MIRYRLRPETTLPATSGRPQFPSECPLGMRLKGTKFFKFFIFFQESRPLSSVQQLERFRRSSSVLLCRVALCGGSDNGDAACDGVGLGWAAVEEGWLDHSPQDEGADVAATAYTRKGSFAGDGSSVRYVSAQRAGGTQCRNSEQLCAMCKH